MQLTRLVRRSGGAVWLLLVVPVLAAGGTVGLMADDEPPMRSLATVSVIAPEGSSTAATVTQAVDAFESTVTSDTVRSLASGDTGVTVGEGAVTAARIGTSNLVELRVSTASEAEGADVLQALVAHANDVLYSSAIASTEARVETAERRYQAALDDRSEESARTGLLLPVEAYRAKAAEVTQLRVALVTATEIDRAEVQEVLTEAVRELHKIGESVNAFESLEDSVVRARTELGDAHEEADAVSSRRTAATAPESVTVTELVAQSARTTLTRGAITAAVLGLALALGLVLLIGLLRRPGVRRPPEDDEGESRPGPVLVAPEPARSRRAQADYEAAAR